MVVWALLQFAHDNPETADYLRQLPSTVDSSHLFRGFVEPKGMESE